MAKKKAAKKKATRGGRLQLIVSDEKKPKITVAAGEKLEVVAVSLIDPGRKPARATAARLCGGTSTCLALVDVS